MPFPFVTRAHHEDVVNRLKDQIKGLAMRIYPDGVPEETQLVLGIKIEARTDVEPEPVLSEEQQAIARMKQEQARDRANISRIARLSPSKMGKEMARYMEKWGPGGQSVTSPAHAVFAQAEAEAIKKFPQA